MKRKELFSLVQKVWFNNPYIKNISESDKISYKEGEDVYQLFHKNNVHICDEIYNGIDEVKMNGAKIRVLSPFYNDLCDSNSCWSDKVAVGKNDWDMNIHELAKKQNRLDDSLSNLASISFLFEYECIRIMLLGDSNPATIVTQLNKLGYSESNPIIVDYVKLAHHGSKYSISDELISVLRCNKFLVSSNGSNLSKQTLAKLIVYNQKKYKQEVEFYFNYPSSVYNGLFNADEIDEFDIKCFFADSKEHCIELDLKV